MVEWANSLVDSSSIDSLSDDTLSDGLYMLLLIDSLSDAVDWKLGGDDPEENCRYCIEVARFLEVPVFLLWSDITRVNSKMIHLFMVTL